MAIMGGFHLYNLLYILIDDSKESWKRLTGFSLLLTSIALIAKQARNEYRQSRTYKKPRSNNPSILTTKEGEEVRNSTEGLNNNVSKNVYDVF